MRINPKQIQITANLVSKRVHDWSRTKTDKHANVAGYITVSSQNTRLPGFTFMFYPMSFKANTEPEDVGERLLSVLSPFAFEQKTWEDLRKDVLTRANAHQYTKSFVDKTEFERSHLARAVPVYSCPLLERWNVRGGVMSHSEDTVRKIFNSLFGFNFAPSNPKRFDALEDIDRDMKVDYTEAHPFRPSEKGFSRWFIVAPDDLSDPHPRMTDRGLVYRPIPYNDALQPDELYDWDLLRYQLKNWRIKETVITASGESADAPLKLNDDFGQSLQMIYHKKLLSNIQLTEEEEFIAQLSEKNPQLLPVNIEAMPDGPAKSHAWASYLAEQKAAEDKKKRNIDQSDTYAVICYQQGFSEADFSWLENEDMSWMNNL